MDKVSYLLKQTPQVIHDTWYALGAAVATPSTRTYIKDMVYRVVCHQPGTATEAPEMNDRFIYAAEDYRVDDKRFLRIDWATTQVDDVKHVFVSSDNVMVPYFITLPGKYDSSFVPDEKFLPFIDESGDAMYDDGGVNISDSELELVLSDIGFPFLTFQDVEFSKAEIKRVFIKPAMDRFFTFFPIVIEEPGYNYGGQAGSEFLVPYPEGAYACIPYYTTPGGANAGNPGSPFAFYNEQLFYGGGGFGWGGGGMGRGVRYVGKRQPGFVGLEQRNAWIDKLAEQQAFLNYFRREKYSRKKINGRLYAYGFTTISGNLNFKWLKRSYYWDDDIPFDLLEPVARPMAKSAVLQQFAMLRQLVKTDIAGQLDATVLSNTRKEYEDAIGPILKGSHVHSWAGAMRGGG